MGKLICWLRWAVWNRLKHVTEISSFMAISKYTQIQIQNHSNSTVNNANLRRFITPLITMFHVASLNTVTHEKHLACHTLPRDAKRTTSELCSQHKVKPNPSVHWQTMNETDPVRLDIRFVRVSWSWIIYWIYICFDCCIYTYLFYC